MNYTFSKILTSESIGDSLSTVNLNYLNLDEWVYNIQLSAQNYWLPLANFYTDVVVDLKTNVLSANSFKPNWDSVTSNVQTNSAKWIQPLVIVYPTIIPLDQILPDNTLVVSKYNEITNWLNLNFPAISGANQSSYVQNQKGYVYVIKQSLGNQIKNVITLQNNINCATEDGYVCTYCANDFRGYVYCSNGNFTCDGNTIGCTQCTTVPCRFPQTQTRNYSPTIQAFLNVEFQDLRESTNISCLKFEIQNCKWIYNSQI